MRSSEAVNLLLMGAITLGHLLAAVYFLRFWRDSRDRLFLWFAIAFGILGVQRIAVAMTTQGSEAPVFLYVIRLLAFMLILAAIVDKNRAGPQQSP